MVDIHVSEVFIIVLHSNQPDAQHSADDPWCSEFELSWKNEGSMSSDKYWAVVCWWFTTYKYSHQSCCTTAAQYTKHRQPLDLHIQITFISFHARDISRNNIWDNWDLLSIKEITFGERELVEDREQFVCKIEPYVSFSNPDILSIYCMQI